MSPAEDVQCKKRLDRRDAWRSGNVAVIFAIALPVVVGVCGLGGEAGYWYYKTRSLQSAADVAAYDGAVVLKAGGSVAQINSAAATGATSNGWSASGGTIAVNTPPTSGTHQNASSVEVILTQNQPRFFSAVYSQSQVTAGARAVATTSGSAACVLALHPTANNAITVSGSANLNAGHCDVVSDSNASSAIDMGGSAALTADCIVSVGSAVTTSGLTLQKCTSATNHAAAVADPYASVPQPSQSGTCLTLASNAPLAWPGWYCHGISVAWGPITFQRGLYVVSGQDLDFNAGTNATGTGVTFFIAAGRTMSVSGTSTVQFSAPTSGTYAGILFFGDRTATNGNNAFSGSSVSSVSGAIYFPTQEVTYSGGTAANPSCTELVASTITISGSAYFTSTCPGSGMTTINTVDGQPGTIRMAE